MKKLISILLVLLSLFLLAGCQSKQSSIKDIKITVDQKTLNGVEAGKKNYQNGN